MSIANTPYKMFEKRVSGETRFTKNESEIRLLILKALFIYLKGDSSNSIEQINK